MTVSLIQIKCISLKIDYFPPNFFPRPEKLNLQSENHVKLFLGHTKKSHTGSYIASIKYSERQP